jgi:pSer/pThr/pTyr-binding forkhead associated (FHA) protein
MNPRLAIISGPLKGRVITLADEAVSIGRESSNQIFLSDASASRRHSLITREGEAYRIQDLESLNSTFVNDVPIKERTLEHGDRVKIGDSQMLFLLHARFKPRPLRRAQNPRRQRRDDSATRGRRVSPDGARPLRLNEDQHDDQRAAQSRRTRTTLARIDF